MCGIAGIVHTDARPVSSEALRRMADAMAHRGPDGEGVWHSGAAGFAHRRLAIIDLEGGHQPMCSDASGAVLTFNGEIYNYRELRSTLTNAGHAFRQQSDTEVVLRAWEHWGDTCVDHLHGMFAFAIWAPLAGRMFIARDRLGIKPLYYRWRQGTLTFASELRALLSDPDCPRRVDDASFDQYLRLQYVPAPRTMVAGIAQLPPGSTLTLNPDASSPSVRQYWRPHAAPDAPRGVDAFRDRLQRAVQSHMVADVPVGALLSGGVDSSLIVAHMTAVATGPVHTFSIGFEEAALDERLAAREVAGHLGTVHHEHLITERDALEALPSVVTAFDEPLADYAALPTWLLARFAASHVKVVLSGEGADELFGGYRRYRRDQRLAAIEPFREPYQASHVFPTREVARLLGRAATPLSPPPAVDGRTRGTLNRLLLRDIEGWLPDDLLVKVDRMTMARSLEARVPYLDHAFVEYALGLPASDKVHLLGGPDKRLLRAAAARVLPPSIAARTKQGFKPPIDAWIRGPFRTLAREALLGRDAVTAARLDRAEVQRLFEAHEAGRPNGHRIWALLVHELWSREHRVG